MVDVRSFIILFKCIWIKRLICLYKLWMDIFYVFNGDDILQKLYDFGDSFVFDCLLKENNVFWKDVFYFWLCYIKIINNYLIIKDNILNVLVWYNFNIKVVKKNIFL